MRDERGRGLTREQGKVLQAFSRALGREAHVLTEHPDLLWQQLYNRLQWEGEDVKAFASGCLRTYLVLNDKVHQFKEDAEIHLDHPGGEYDHLLIRELPEVWYLPLGLPPGTELMQPGRSTHLRGAHEPGYRFSRGGVERERGGDMPLAGGASGWEAESSRRCQSERAPVDVLE